MKKTLNIALGILFCFLLIGCQKDSDGSDPVVNSTNHFKVGNVEYPLSQGKLTLWNNGYDRCSISLFSSTITMGGDGYLNGPGYYMELDCINSNSSELDEGKYVIDLTGTNKMHTIYNMAYNLVKIGGADDQYFVNITKGEVDFKSIGNGIYEVKIDCATNTGVQVTGYYKGALHKFYR